MTPNLLSGFMDPLIMGLMILVIIITIGVFAVEIRYLE
jgi:hydrogenase/urease accessory protein HupE